MSGRRSTTAPTPEPIAPTPTPVEDVPPTRTPEPRPEPEPPNAEEMVAIGDALREVREEEDSLPPTGAFRLTPDGAEPIPADRVAETARRLAALVQGVTPGSLRALSAVDREDYPLTVWEAIAEVTRRVEPIAKDRTATQGGSYKYRGIDDVLEALHDLLGDVGLAILPGRVVRETWETRATSSGGTLNVARLLVRYTLVGPDGTKLRAEVWGEGGDSGDKATQKAHSQSYKTLCLQTFSIPTQSSRDDEPDATNPPSRPFSEDEVHRAQTAWQAARAADTVEKLAGVRHRAVALLNVPVPTGDGGLAPLALAIDGRRVELERVVRGGEPA